MFTDLFFVRLLINTVAMIVLVRFVYFPAYTKQDNYLPFFLLNLLIFLVAYMLESTHAFTTLGGAFGLLAAFSLLRFRTTTISLKDMTYLFITMAIGLINSIMKGEYFEIIIMNVIIVLAVYVVDSNKVIRRQETKVIDYNDLQYIKPEDHDKLIKQLIEITGLDIRKVAIESINYTTQTVKVRIYYY